MLFGILLGAVARCDAAPDADLSEYREPPLRELATVRTVSVADFGAIPNDEVNDRAAIQKALDELAAAKEPTKLLFPTGRYLLDMPDAERGEKNSMLILANCTNAVIDFQGSEITVRNPSRGFFRVEQSAHVIVRNATVDYDPIPHTEGIIRAVDPKTSTIDLEIRAGFPAPDQEYFNKAPSRWGYQLDPVVPGRLKNGAVNFHNYTTIERIDGNLFRIGLKVSQKSSWPLFGIGDRFCLLARGGGSFFFAEKSRQITAMNITSLNTPSGHYLAVMTEAYNIIGCKSPIKPGFWKGGNADAVHCQSCRVGPWVEDCLFEGISDDALVIYARPFSVVKQLAPDRLEISRLTQENRASSLMDGEVQVGDVLDFLNPETGIILATATVTAYDPAARLIELDRVVTGINPGIDKQKTQIWNRAMGSGFVMKDNVVKNSRRYGIYLKASNGLIEDNTLEGLSSCAITLHNEPRAPNGPFCHDILIRNNTINDCGFEQGFLKYEETGVLGVKARRWDYRDAQSGTAHSNIRIENNRFSKILRPPVFLSNVDGAELSGNTLDGAPFASNDIVIKSSKNVEVK